MTRQDIATLAMRLLGVYAWLLSLSYFGAFTSVIAGGIHPTERNTVSVSLLAPALLLAIAGSVLFFGGARLGRSLLPPGDQSIGSSTIRAADVQMVAFSILGLALFVFALPDAARLIASMMIADVLDSGSPSQKVRYLNELPQIINVLVRLVAGVALFIRTKQVSDWWMRNRLASGAPNA